jgi:hypothetical protein
VYICTVPADILCILRVYVLFKHIALVRYPATLTVPAACNCFPVLPFRFALLSILNHTVILSYVQRKITRLTVDKGEGASSEGVAVKWGEGVAGRVAESGQSLVVQVTWWPMSYVN